MPGVAFGVIARLRPGLLLGGEARYFRKCDGISLDEQSETASGQTSVWCKLPGLGSLGLVKLRVAGLVVGSAIE